MGEAAQSIWVESLWLTHRESVTVTHPQTGESVTREVSVGMTVKSDRSAKSSAMYSSVRKALDRIVEEEKESWLDSHKMAVEPAKLKEALKEAGNGAEGTDQAEGTAESGADTPAS